MGGGGGGAECLGRYCGSASDNCNFTTASCVAFPVMSYSCRWPFNKNRMGKKVAKNFTLLQWTPLSVFFSDVVFIKSL